jgi:hypothetical protein
MVRCLFYHSFSIFPKKEEIGCGLNFLGLYLCWVCVDNVSHD